MPTIDDLHAAYAALKDRAPGELRAFGTLTNHASTEITLLGNPRGGTHPRQRRILLPALVAAGVVAAVAAGVTVLNSGSSAHHNQNAGSASIVAPAATNVTVPIATAPNTNTGGAASGDSYPVLPATGSVFTVASLPDGLHASSGITSPYMEQMTLASSSGKLAGIITVVNSLAWHPAIPADAVTVKIGTQTGYYGTINFDYATGNADSWFLANASFFTAGDADEQGVLWQDPSGLWAYITGVTNAGIVKTASTDANYSLSTPVPTGTAPAVTTTGAAGAPVPTGGPARSEMPGAYTSTPRPDPYTTSRVPGPYAGLPTAALSPTQAVAVANAIHIGTTQVAKVPIKLGYIPMGFSADDTVDFTASTLNSLNKNHFIGGVTVTNPDATNPIYNTLYIGLSAGSIPDGVAVAYKDQPFVESPKMTTITIAGYTGRYSPDSPTVVLRNGTVSLSIGVSDGPGQGVPLAELTKLVQGITLASNVNDQSTWFGADKALA